MGAEPDADSALLAGRYEVGPLVGLGATAQVYRGFDHRCGRAVAVKVFRPGSAPAPGHGGARELQVLAGVSHPGLVGIQDSGVDAQGCPFVVMDFVDGSSLAARLHDGPLPAAAVARIGIALAEALAAVHVRGVVHRDVKPANVLLDADDRPWLTDFGIARIVDATRVTETGVVVGTAAYMAPEQVRGEPVGPPTDVYALGLVLLEAVTGRREYEGGALESALARLHRAPEIPGEVPDPLGAALQRMTALDPGARPTAAEVATALQNAPEPRRPGRRRAVPVAALACLVAAALTGGLTLLGGAPPAGGPAAAEVSVAVPPAILPSPVPQVPGAVTGAAAAAVTAGPVGGPGAAPRPVPVALTSREVQTRVAAAPSGSSGRSSSDKTSSDRTSTRHAAKDTSTQKTSAPGTSKDDHKAADDKGGGGTSGKSGDDHGKGSGKSDSSGKGNNGEGDSGKGGGDRSGSNSGKG